MSLWAPLEGCAAGSGSVPPLSWSLAALWPVGVQGHRGHDRHLGAVDSVGAYTTLADFGEWGFLKESKSWDGWHPYKGHPNFAKHSVLLVTTVSLFITLLAFL